MTQLPAHGTWAEFFGRHGKVRFDFDAGSVAMSLVTARCRRQAPGAVMDATGS
jgi:hypothetical protein